MCIVAAVLAIGMSGCSRRPRDDYAHDLLKKLDLVHASLERCRAYTDSAAKATTGVVAVTVAVDVGSGAKTFGEAFDVIALPVYMDIVESGDYAAWADRTAGALRAKADRCLALIQEIDRQYRENPHSAKFDGWICFDGVPTRGTHPVWQSPKGELVFAVELTSREGIPVESMLRLDFRQLLDRIRKQQYHDAPPGR